MPESWLLSPATNLNILGKPVSRKPVTVLEGTILTNSQVGSILNRNSSVQNQPKPVICKQCGDCWLNYLSIYNIGQAEIFLPTNLSNTLQELGRSFLISLPLLVCVCRCWWSRPLRAMMGPVAPSCPSPRAAWSGCGRLAKWGHSSRQHSPPFTSKDIVRTRGTIYTTH